MLSILANLAFVTAALGVASKFLVPLANDAGIPTSFDFIEYDDDKSFSIFADLSSWAVPISVDTSWGVRVQVLCFVFSWEN